MSIAAISLSSRPGAAVRITLPRSKSSRMVRCAQPQRSKLKSEAYPAGPASPWWKVNAESISTSAFSSKKTRGLATPGISNRRTEGPSRGVRRTTAVGSYKLFPVSFDQTHLYKNAAFDVCRSQNVNTFFQRWDEIKHNIIVNWVDLVDAEESQGIALISDHTTAYTHGPTHPLALVLGWAWEGGFWWAKHPLRGEQEISYAIIPHHGRWDQASIAQESSRYNEPFVTQLIDGHRSEIDDTFSLLNLKDPGIQVSTLLIEKGLLLVRLFNAESNQAEQVVSFSERPLRIEVVELDGRVTEKLEVHSVARNTHQVTLKIPRFGLRVLRCAW